MVRTCLGPLLLALLTPGPAAADHGRPDRVSYLSRAVDAVRRLGDEGRGALADAMQTGARRRCRADRGDPSIACLIDLARAHCESQPSARAACHLAADVVVTNLLSESELVDQATRVRLVNRGGDYRAAMRAELRVRYAALAADFALAEPGPDSDLPARIDRFCARPDRQLAWQRCAAALVWYIGAHGGATREGPAP
jgi:hypothetical protein